MKHISQGSGDIVLNSEPKRIFILWGCLHESLHVSSTSPVQS